MTDAIPASRERLVVIGNGMAGIRVLEELIELAPDRYQISVLSDEPHGSYNRILLSPVLSGEKQFADIVTHGDDWYTERGIHLHKGVRATAIQRPRRTIETEGAGALPYDRLILATGSEPVVIPVPGHQLPGVVTFRDIADVDRMLAVASAGKHAVVIGGGLLGLEAAYGLLRRGMTVTVVHLHTTLMERQLDSAAGGLIRSALEEQGIQFLLNAHTREIVGESRVTAVAFKDGQEVPADLVVMAVGVRPRTALARDAGIYCERGIVVNDTLQTFDPRVYAVGECVQHRRETFGLVAPLYEQAKVCANHLAALGFGAYRGSTPATRLKVTGIELFSMGRISPEPGDEEIVLQDASQRLYKKLVLREGRIAGGVLFGDAGDSGWYLDLMRQKTDVTSLRSRLLFGPGAEEEGGASDVGKWRDETEVCGCNGVCKGAIVAKIRELGLATLDEVRKHTKASSSCGSCTGLVERLLASEVKGYTAPAVRALCGCTDKSSDQVREAVSATFYASVFEAMEALGWKTADGCASCRPALNYYLVCAWPTRYHDDPKSRLVNERLHANIQQDGTYSVVPRMWGGMTTPAELRAIADVAEKFRIPAVKVTGGQRIDLLGVTREQLPLVWADLNRAGLVSGHAYGKAVRTVKTCVGKEWCRFGTQDSTALGIALEKLTWGAWTPHKFKMGVSACPRNCAEVTIKDFGAIGVESGWDIHVGGNGGVVLRGTDVLVHVETDAEVLEYAAAFLQYYREDARYLERTAPWIERVGIETIRECLVQNTENRSALRARFLEGQLRAQQDPWAERATGHGEFAHVEAQAVVGVA